MESCAATIFSSHATLKKIQAYFCFTKEIRWTTHFNFFESKFKESKIADGSPPGHLICSSWRFTKNTRDGKLKPLSGLRNFQTSNKVNYQYEYVWPTAKSGLVRNHYLTRAVITYDFYRDTLSSTVLPMANCHISLEYCTSQTMTVVWDVTDKGDCPVTTSLGN